ncbi:MAG: glycosyltransferase family 39 protein [Anaerolineae bacterium]|nr:glycosyltransferase family 39 protein [Anaerolineae bacterium]
MMLRQPRRWWAGLGVIVSLAAALRFTGFTFGLPYFDQIDEPWLFYEAAYQRGLLSWWLHPNPSPGLINLWKLAQIVSEAITHQSALNHVTEIITVMRFISVILSLLTLVLIGQCAHALAGDKAGWLAAATWAVIPYVIYHSFIAIAEPWMMLFESLALFAAVMTLHHDGIGWPLLSVWGGLLAFAFKYSMFPFAGIGLAVVLWRIWVQPSQRRKWLTAAVLQLASIVGFLLILALFAGLSQDVGSPSREVAVFLKNPLAHFANPGYVAWIVGIGFWQFGMSPLVFVLIYAAALILLERQQRSIANPRLATWTLFGALGAVSALLVPLYLMTDATIARYLFAAGMVFVILAAGSCAVLYDYLCPRLSIRRHGLALASLVLIALWLRPLALEAVHDARERTKPYTLTDMTVWASYSLGEGAILTEGLGHRAFSREMGGYTGINRAWTYDHGLLERPPDQWQRDGYRYVELAQENEQKIKQTPEGRAYLNQILELRRFPPTGTTRDWTGPAFVVYQLNRPQTPLNIIFGNTFTLIGCDGLTTSAAPGDTLVLRFYWQARQTPTRNYALFVHVRPMAVDQIIAQADGTPGPVGRPTRTWDVPSETLVSGTFTLMIPPTVRAGRYRLVIGLYDPTTGERLSAGQTNEVVLTTLVIARDF